MALKTIIIGNYGNDSIALLQWVISQNLSDVVFCYAETGWAAPSWSARVQAGEQYAKKHGITSIRVKSPVNLNTMTRDRGAFPTRKFQWCASFAKGLPILEWLDEIDPSCEATILQGKRRNAARVYQHLPIEEISNYYNGRVIRYPLLDESDEGWQRLIREAGFDILPHRSLECEPCVHNQLIDFQRLNESSIQRISKLEQMIDCPMFFPEEFNGVKGIEAITNYAKKHEKISENDYHENLLMGCGMPWGCGE